MEKYMKTIMQGLFLFGLTLFCTMQFNMDVHADFVSDKENGVSYSNEDVIIVGYANEVSYGGGGYSLIHLNNGDRVSNIQSNSKNLIAQKTLETFSLYEWSDSCNYYVTYISYFAKKKGTYKVSFDVIKADGTKKCTKTITVKAVSNTSTTSPVKSIKYAGKDLYTYMPYSTKTSGKLKVSLKKNYKLVSIEIGKYNKKGNLVYTKVKNNQKIKLATKEVKRYDSKYSDGSTSYTYDCLLPYTEIRITYKDKKTGETEVFYTSLNTLNKKQSW